jgi:aminopeptidase N
MKLTTYLLAISSCVSVLAGQQKGSSGLPSITDSGGPILREQAAYDVTFYHLDLAIDPLTRSISGSLLARATAVDTLSQFVLDLNDQFAVDSVLWDVPGEPPSPLQFSRLPGRIWASLPRLMQPSESIGIRVFYDGVPKEALTPPYTGGFGWATDGQQPWVGLECEVEGADLWWPCKDHPSDEPDSMAIDLTVPATLTAVSNGRLRGVTEHGSTKTFHWFVSTPINNYCVTFYLGAYERIPVDYTSVSGEKIPAEYWFLPANVETAKAWVPTFLKDLRFLEETCGPFPFRTDKYAIADANYWGMEHQTVIAYGNSFRLNEYGYDYIHLHELAHEWWGNLVTAKDWTDLWIHEGLATYMEALFVERNSGFARYKELMASRKGFANKPSMGALAPYESKTAQEAFSTTDPYLRGSWVIHTLRYYLGDSTFFRVLRRWAYPDPSLESITDGRQCRLATTDEFRMIAEQVSGRELDWFFRVYFREVALPQLLYWNTGTTLNLQWVTEGGGEFPMPVEVDISGAKVRVDMNGNKGSVTFPTGSVVSIDPDSWLLMPDTKVTSVEEQASDDGPRRITCDVYPNPFNAAAEVRITLGESMFVRASIYSVSGERVQALVDGELQAGSHSFRLNLANQGSGIYFLDVRGNHQRVVRKLVLMK